MNRFVLAYLECALFVSLDDQGKPLDKMFDVKDFSAAALVKADTDCRNFMRRAGNLLNGVDFEQAGKDLWLSRNGHGAGFKFNRNYPSGVAAGLHKVAHAMGESHVMVLGNRLDLIDA